MSRKCDLHHKSFAAIVIHLSQCRSLLSTAALLLALACVAPGLRAHENLADLVARVTPSVVGVGAAFPPRVPTGGRAPQRLLGSGFAVQRSPRSVVITNDHVIPDDIDSESGERLAVFSGRGATARRHFATVLARDPQHDLAVLAYEGEALPGLALGADGDVRPGQRVAFTGFPIGAVLGLYPATHEAIVAAVTPIARPATRARDLSAAELKRLRDPFEVFQLDAIAYPGNSGSAVYDAEAGAVIGVMNSVFVKESRESLLSAPSGIAYAIPVRHVHRLLERLD